MKIASWILFASGVFVFFRAGDQLTGWIGIMMAVVAAAILLYMWSQDSGYMAQSDDRPVR